MDKVQAKAEALKILHENTTTLVDNNDMWIRGIHPDDIEGIADEIANKLADLESKEE